MSYHEKRAIVSMISSVLITVVYSVVLFQRYLSGSDEYLNDPRFWGAAFLVFIVVSILANILITVAFTIYYRITAHEDAPAFSDERDKLIELIGTRNASYTFSIGVVLSMVSLVLYMPLYVMFILIVFSGLMSLVIDNFTQLYLYRKGF